MLLPGLEDHVLFGVACLITAFALLILGAFKARFHDKAYCRSGVLPGTGALGSGTSPCGGGRWLQTLVGRGMGSCLSIGVPRAARDASHI